MYTQWYRMRYVKDEWTSQLTGAPLTSPRLGMISIEFRHAFQLRHPKCFVYALDEVPRSPTPAHYPTLLKHSVNRTALFWYSAKEDAFTAIDIAVYDLCQHLSAGAIDRGDPVDIEDDVFIVLRRSNTW